jgi:hypothetical protein
MIGEVPPTTQPLVIGNPSERVMTLKNVSEVELIEEFVAGGYPSMYIFLGGNTSIDGNVSDRFTEELTPSSPRG